MQPSHDALFIPGSPQSKKITVPLSRLRVNYPGQKSLRSSFDPFVDRIGSSIDVRMLGTPPRRVALRSNQVTPPSRVRQVLLGAYYHKDG
jgi:hypothetical protein